MPSSQVEGVMASLRAETAKAAKALVLEIDKELRRSTPVDTGHAHRNWVPSVAQPNETEAADDSAHAAGIAAVLAYKLGDGSLWVANVVPYIQALNYGHSQQQPAGFVERAIDVALQRLQTKYDGTSIDVSSLRDAFARRNENAQGHGAAPDGSDGSGWSGGEYG